MGEKILAAFPSKTAMESFDEVMENHGSKLALRQKMVSG